METKTDSKADPHNDPSSLLPTQPEIRELQDDLNTEALGSGNGRQASVAATHGARVPYMDRDEAPWGRKPHEPKKLRRIVLLEIEVETNLSTVDPIVLKSISRHAEGFTVTVDLPRYADINFKGSVETEDPDEALPKIEELSWGQTWRR